MLVNIPAETYYHYFSVSPHPFISRKFIELNETKCEKLVFLVEENKKPNIGFVAGIRNNRLLSPFSAPFGGFHFRKESVYITEIDEFISSLTSFLEREQLKGLDITLPSDIYGMTFNSKAVSSMLRKGFQPHIPDINGWIDLVKFGGEFAQRKSREYFRQAVRNELSFDEITMHEDKRLAYDLIKENRAKFDRPIYMDLNDILATSNLWQTDFFKVTSKEGKILASAIFYRSHPEIVHALFWGDNDSGRPLRAMDFLAYGLWNYYKDLGFKYIDLGISTEDGHPNEGLLRFKESHDSSSSLRYSFTWENENL